MQGDEEEFYKELEEMFRNGVCEQVNEYQYIGPTCGANGLTIELAVYSDEDCTTMAPVSSYGYMENVDMGGYYMNTLLDLYTQPFSCSMGMQMDYVSIICVHLGISSLCNPSRVLTYPLFDTNHSRTEMQILLRHVKNSLNTPFPKISATTAISTTSTTIMRPPRKETRTSGLTRTSRPIVLRFLSNKTFC